MMGSAVDNLSIYLEHDIDEQYQYQPGEIVRGHLDVTLTRPLTIRTISISVYGQGAVACEDRELGSLHAHEEYINASKQISHGSEHYNKGQHRFPFDYLLPNNLPSSFIGKYGSVTYVLKAVIHGERPGETSITSEPFLVLRRTMLPEQCNKTVGTSAQKRVWAMCDSGKLKVSVELNKVGFCPGEDIFISAKIGNKTPLKVTAVQASLIMDSVYHAKQQKIPFHQIVNKRRDMYELESGEGRRWQNVRLTVPPYIPESGLENCDIIGISYKFQFRVELLGGKEVRMELPVLVGTHHMGLDIPENAKLDNGRYNNEWSTRHFPGRTDEIGNGFEREPEKWEGGVPELRPVDSTMINPLFQRQTSTHHERPKKISTEEMPEIMENTKL
uniref:Arrestin domain-containing protein 4-like n=1 Tax=Crassostrea virginica TaxID=6565 RepID=A0A8B8D6Z3_CRAVI|nr:arrestin domain-containing protein 4-like [Crassostrea virginica]XP_022323898.1 arrestin domain-containing protein 4-like [Crassostrea virginica]XP_022323899.1 arrestin domain-containing protein 4-like [Crassostrea virginica]XP_022323900.1 arrestin domain-containing protein 4-like [Crassostrea virginica]XP_022323901.1 arrestin domain-containing protein 4-like [Crassostrea virginica]